MISDPTGSKVTTGLGLPSENVGANFLCSYFRAPMNHQDWKVSVKTNKKIANTNTHTNANTNANTKANTNANSNTNLNSNFNTSFCSRIHQGPRCVGLP